MNLGDQWEIDSAAIGGWHVGNPPDWRALDTMKNHNVPYNNHARQVNTQKNIFIHIATKSVICHHTYFFLSR